LAWCQLTSATCECRDKARLHVFQVIAQKHVHDDECQLAVVDNHCSLLAVVNSTCTPLAEVDVWYLLTTAAKGIALQRLPHEGRKVLQ